MKKSGAIELSIGTIVIIVLAMSMLILGLVLVKNIFTGSINVADMTVDQIKDQVNKMFGEDKRVVIYPDTKHIDVKGGDVTGFGIGIKNLLQGSQAGTSFEYEVVVSDNDITKKCGVTAQQAEGWISTGRTEKLEIAPGQSTAGKALIEVPEGSKLCTFRYRVNVKQVDGTIYDSDFIDVTIKG